jgi:hypothetical protein
MDTNLLAVIAGFFTGGALAIRGGYKAARNSAIGCACLLAVIEGVGIGFQRMMAENTRLDVCLPCSTLLLHHSNTSHSYHHHLHLQKPAKQDSPQSHNNLPQFEFIYLMSFDPHDISKPPNSTLSVLLHQMRGTVVFSLGYHDFRPVLSCVGIAGMGVQCRIHNLSRACWEGMKSIVIYDHAQIWILVYVLVRFVKYFHYSQTCL